jgi:hypothetical protein
MYPLIVVMLVSRESSMDKTLFNSTLPVVITDLQLGSSQLRAIQTAARQDKSTPMASPQIAAAQGPGPARGALNPSFSRDSLASTSSLESEVHPEIQSYHRRGLE